MMCGKCGKISSVIFLVLGILFLVADLTTWNFWGIQWWSALFVVVGVIGFASGYCGECCGEGKSMSKKK